MFHIDDNPLKLIHCSSAGRAGIGSSGMRLRDVIDGIKIKIVK